MIDPVTKRPPNEISLHPSFAKRFSPPLAGDQLVSASKTKSAALKWIKTKLLSKIWRWIQITPSLRWLRTLLTKLYSWLNYYVLSLFRDEVEEKRQEQQGKLNKFLDLFFEGIKNNTENDRVKVKKAFEVLDRDLRALIKEKLYGELQKNQPNSSDEDLNDQVKKVLENPFLDFGDNDEGAPMGKALFAARDKIWNEK